MPFSLFWWYALFLFFSAFSPPFSSAEAVPSLFVPFINSSQNPWRNFSEFIDMERGSSAPGISQLRKYFFRFGYLSADQLVPNNSDHDLFDSSLEDAVFKYQRNLGIPASGKLDYETLDLIMAPRCGVGDKKNGDKTALFHATRKFAYFYGHPRWVKPAPVMLTYAFSKAHMINYLSAGEISRVFRRAFSRWSAVIPVNFMETADYDAADVKIGFHRGDHGDGEPFDGVLGILAHAFSPENGRLHLDAAETWAVDFEAQRSKVAVDLESVATHEIGHVLGLAHSSVKEAIMYPSLSPRSKKTELRIDDVEGVQALYGSNPNFKFNSLLASETSAAAGGGEGVDLAVRWRSWWGVSTAALAFFLFFL